MFGKKSKEKTNIEKIVEELSKIPDYKKLLNPPATLEQIEEFEKEKGFKFPKDYKDFLQLWNGGEYIGPGTIMLGIKDVPGWCSFEKKNELYKDKFSADYILIGILQYGDLILMNLNDGTVSILEMETGKIVETLDNLYEFIDDDVEEFLDSHCFVEK